jgi:hypothetical protein
LGNFSAARVRDGTARIARVKNTTKSFLMVIDYTSRFFTMYLTPPESVEISNKGFGM